MSAEIDYHLQLYTDRAQDIRDMMAKFNSILLGSVPLAVALMNEDVRAESDPVLILATPAGGAEGIRQALMDRGYERILRYRDRQEGQGTKRDPQRK